MGDKITSWKTVMIYISRFSRSRESPVYDVHSLTFQQLDLALLLNEGKLEFRQELGTLPTFDRCLCRLNVIYPKFNSKQCC